MAFGSRTFSILKFTIVLMSNLIWFLINRQPKKLYKNVPKMYKNYASLTLY